MERCEALVKISVMAKLFSLSCSTASSWKDDSSFFLKVLLLILIILRKSSWEKLNTMLDSSLDMDVVVFVAVDWMSVVFFEVFCYLLRKVGKYSLFSRS